MTPAASPGVSVIIPLYNKERTIERAIESVLAQDAAPVEVVVVDDGSTDGSAGRVESLDDPRIRLLKQANAGPGAARNAGVAASTGALLAFLDADDEWRPSFLGAAQQALRDASVVAYACGYDAGDFRQRRPNKVEALGKSAASERIDPATDGAALKAHVDAMHSSCVVVRRAIFDRLGGFYAKAGCRYGEDSYLWLGVLFSGPVYWDAAERVRFHVEDSVLGFGGGSRTSARPISLEGDQLRPLLPPEMQGALDRAVGAFVRHDLALLKRSNAFAAMADLRRRHGLDRPFDPIADRISQFRAAARRNLRALRSSGEA